MSTPEPPEDSFAVDAVPVVAAEPDQAWKALGLVNDWIKHAETKVGATLAATGVTGGVLYNLIKDRQNVGLLLLFCAAACGLLVVSAGVCAALALLPRTHLSSRKEDPTSPLYFNHIARAYGDNAPSYSEILRALTGDRDALTRHIAHQTHANAVVAHRKYIWANRSLSALLGALLMLAASAAIVGIQGI